MKKEDGNLCVNNIKFSLKLSIYQKMTKR